MNIKLTRFLFLMGALTLGVLSMAVVTTARVPGADLVVSKQTGPSGLSSVTAGSFITYRVTSTVSSSSGTISSLSIGDRTPPGTWWSSHTPSSGGVCTMSPYGIGGADVTCTWTGGTAVGESHYFDLTVMVCSGDTEGYSIVSDYASTSGSAEELNPGDNQQVGHVGGTVPAVTTTVTTQSEFQTVGSSAPYAVSQGGQVTYTIDIQNLGPSSAQTTVATTLPSGWTVNSATTSYQGPCSGLGGGIASCDLYLGGTNLCVGYFTSDTITIVADVPGSAPGGNVTATVQVSSTNGQPDTGDTWLTINNAVGPIFYDGFESGGTSAWSSTIG